MIFFRESTIQQFIAEELKRILGGTEHKASIRKQVHTELTDYLEGPEYAAATQARVREVLVSDMTAREVLSRSFEQLLTVDIRNGAKARLDAVVREATTEIGDAVQRQIGELRESAAESMRNLKSSTAKRLDKERQGIEAEMLSIIGNARAQFETEMAELRARVVREFDRIVDAEARQRIDDRMRAVFDRYLAENPQFQRPFTNREIAERNRVSLREVKRWRRLASGNGISLEEAARWRRHELR